LRWVGIDEAGYGPNLGPLVMTAVMAESSPENPPAQRRSRSLDFWGDLSSTVDRAGGDPDRLWVDDSKAIFCGGKGRCRLETTCLAAIHAAGNALPRTWKTLLETLGAGTLDEVELSPWLEVGQQEGDGPSIAGEPGLESLLAQRPLVPRCRTWQITVVRTVVVGPSLFNSRLSDQGLKSAVHYEAFERLLAWVWDRAADGALTLVLGDKHGGRHYYYGPLTRSFPETWIDRGPEGPDLSRYTLRDQTRRVEVSLAPRADQNDGLVALASIVSKTIRELWMDVFNGYWCARVPGLRPTAGYPNDAKRFRTAIEAVAAEQKCDPARWWRVK
jgi:hypothetical protein